jgi:hypothetical protein
VYWQPPGDCVPLHAVLGPIPLSVTFQSMHAFCASHDPIFPPPPPPPLPPAAKSKNGAVGAVGGGTVVGVSVGPSARKISPVVGDSVGVCVGDVVGESVGSAVGASDAIVWLECSSTAAQPISRAATMVGGGGIMRRLCRARGWAARQLAPEHNKLSRSVVAVLSVSVARKSGLRVTPPLLVTVRHTNNYTPSERRFNDCGCPERPTDSRASKRGPRRASWMRNEMKACMLLGVHPRMHACCDTGDVSVARRQLANAVRCCVVLWAGKRLCMVALRDKTADRVCLLAPLPCSRVKTPNVKKKWLFKILDQRLFLHAGHTDPDPPPRDSEYRITCLTQTLTVSGQMDMHA